MEKKKNAEIDENICVVPVLDRQRQTHQEKKEVGGCIQPELKIDILPVWKLGSQEQEGDESEPDVEKSEQEIVFFL